ncbi:MAG: PhzF family phenazine biosynthesis protein [Phormidesmis sp.]
MELKITQVDAFTNQPFAGNPAAVCVIEQPLEADLMQAIAAEMNLSETAFLYPLQDLPADGYSLRWFTPATEVDLCGHGTLASAHTLWHEGYLPAGQPAKFKTKSGWLGAKQQKDWIEMDFPVQPVEITQYVMPQLIKSLCCGGNIRVVAKNDVNYLVEVFSEQVLQNLRPDFVEMSKLPVQGIIVTAKADSAAYDFVSRYFAPAVGISEDPVTGSAHTSLAPYWQEKLGKATMTARQISARGGIVRVTCQANGRIAIGGQAVTVLKGNFVI